MILEYKGYIAKLEIDAEAELIHGEVINTRDVITFQAGSIHELQRAFADSIDDYLAFCAERGEAPDKPFSGKFMVRSNPELHRDLVAAAARSGKSLNAFVTDTLDKAVHSNHA